MFNALKQAKLTLEKVATLQAAEKEETAPVIGSAIEDEVPPQIGMKRPRIE